MTADIRKFYFFFGVDLSSTGSDQLIGTCPFCHKDSHFYVYIGSPTPKKSPGMFDCKRCGERGNHYTFLTKLHEVSCSLEQDYSDLSESRGIGEATFGFAQLCASFNTGEVFIPSFTENGTINNLYKLVTQKGKLQVRSAPAPCSQKLYRQASIKNSHTTVWVCEGHWDTLVWLETLAHLSERGNKLILKGKPDFDNSLLQQNAVVGVPGANTFKEEWVKSLKGKHVVLLYDNDEAGWKGMNQATRKLEGIRSLHKVIWREGDENDLRDHLLKMNHLKLFNLVSSRIEEVKITPDLDDDVALDSEECTSFNQLMTHYKRELHITQDIEDTIAVLSAVVLSNGSGARFGVRVLGPPGSVKSTLAECFSQDGKQECYPISRFTGIVSGHKDVEEGKQLAHRINNKTVFCKEADMILQLPNLKQVESELRDVLGDGVIRIDYRTKNESLTVHTNTNFVLCGTRTLRNMDDAMLGSRFLDIVVHRESTPDDEIVSRAIDSQSDMIDGFFSKGEGEELKKGVSALAPPTIGFIQHRKEIREKGLTFTPMTSAQKDRIEALGRYVAHCRARVKRKRTDELVYRPEKEVSTRISEQFTSFAKFLAFVFYSPNNGSTIRITKRVLDILTKIAEDTAYGFPSEIVRVLFKHKQGLERNSIASRINLGQTQTWNVLTDMKELGLVTTYAKKNASGQGRKGHHYLLTDELREIMERAGI